ncbi:MAG: TetR/AcrR family transcriptional regulator [Solirubrobacteraceae bacterium]
MAGVGSCAASLLRAAQRIGGSRDPALDLPLVSDIRSFGRRVEGFTSRVEAIDDTLRSQVQSVSSTERPRRLTRDQQRQQTRERLLSSALEVFEARGYDESSLEEIAERAGYTRKAVYSNFSGKSELLLELVERRFKSHIERIEAVLDEEGSTERKTIDVGSMFADYLGEERAWGRLFHEFSSVASRDEDIGLRFRACFRARKQIIVRLVESEVSRRGIELTAPVERLVMGAFALFTGLSVEKMIDPEEVDEALFGEMLGLLATSVMAPSS